MHLVFPYIKIRRQPLTVTALCYRGGNGNPSSFSIFILISQFIFSIIGLLSFLVLFSSNWNIGFLGYFPFPIVLIEHEIYVPNCQFFISHILFSKMFAFSYDFISAGHDQSISSTDNPYPFVIYKKYGLNSSQ